MLTWLNLAIQLIKIGGAIVTWFRERGLIDSGYDKAIAEASAAVLVESKAAKEVLARVTAMSEAQVDDALKQLEPK